MSAPFGAVLVDLDGLLAHTEHLGQEAMEEIWDATGDGPLGSEERQLYVGRPDGEVFADLAVRRGIGHGRARELHRRYRRRYLEKLRNHRLDALPGVRQGLRSLQERYPLALVTGSTREQAETVLRQLELADTDLWREVVTADDVASGKPTPAPYLRAAARLGVPVHRCLVPEDSIPGVLAGRGAGASVLHVGPFHPQTSWIADRQVERLDQVGDELLGQLWSHRPLPAAADVSALRSLGHALGQGRLARILAARLGSGDDLWQAYSEAATRELRSLGPRDRPLWRLWVEGKTVPCHDLRKVLGGSLVRRLLRGEILESPAPGAVRARLRVLAANGILLLKEPPRILRNGAPISRETYLESSSFGFLDRVLEQLRCQGRRPGRVLEIGLGTGLVLLRVLAEFPGAEGVGTDLDGRAVHLARANAALNGLAHRTEVRQGNLFAPLEAGEEFDLVIFHPPYRIMPDELPYPDPLSRYGTGRDGLGVARRFLAGLRSRLAPGGEALMGLELPQTAAGPGRYEDQLRAAAPELRLEFRQVGAVVPAEAIARTGAEKCLQGDTEKHCARILEAYRVIGAEALRPVVVRIRGGEK